MGISKFPAALIFAAVVVVVTVSSRVAEAQVPSCASSLVPCATYINGTGTPPASCCTPLKQALTTQFQCLCNLYANPGVLQSFGINITQAIGLPARCNISASTCPSVSAPTPTSTSSVPSPPPPAGSGVGRIAWAGLPSLLFFWASMVLY
ncbi:hypothetical protein Vadar_000477 [Vaccinium darrowii]|uniref:Uncharacterized protein n=1 Tax=Vaccinium darrowii TaxID=229202 RepID=A0ACB7Z886_9ERIC|nr:hypothetical protein Vadar_000477 [Vaccinium darrowii]